MPWKERRLSESTQHSAHTHSLHPSRSCFVVLRPNTALFGCDLFSVSLSVCGHSVSPARPGSLDNSGERKMPILDYTGKRCVVTGGADGIGLEMSTLFAQQGAEVFILDINRANAEEQAAKLRAGGHKVHAIECNVTSKDSVEAAFAEIARGGRVDVLCNNAGIGHVGNIMGTEVEDMERVMAVNVTGVMLCSKSAIKLMLADGKGGAILNTGSIASIRPIKDRIAYAASKGAVQTLTMALATDHVSDGIRVNSVCPGRIHTPFVDNFIKKNYPGKEEEMFRILSEYMPNGAWGFVAVHSRLANEHG